jgi:endonuclease VIII
VPEGHSIHRYARLHERALAGGPLRITSPQGAESGVAAAVEAAAAAAALDGSALLRAEGYGKHLFYRFERELTLHVHLGLFGRFRSHRAPVPPPRGAVRLRMDSGERAVDLAGATASRLIDPEAEEALLARLGPDPLRRDSDPERAWAAVVRRRIPIGALLLDQRVIAGIGNVYRAEILFACRINPMLEANRLRRAKFDELWETTVAQMRVGERSGRIVTVPASEAGGPPSKLRGKERVQVYRREHCRRCGSRVRTAKLAARTMYWCPRCQPRPRAR